MFSRRVPQQSPPNALSRLVAALRAERTPLVDLTESNPTRVGISYPLDILAPLSDPASLCYAPSPFGLASARQAVAEDQRRRGTVVDPEHVILAASTSETYSWLFKLLCGPGDAVLVPRPSYPLFEHLTALDGVGASSYGLEYDGRWLIDIQSVETAPPNVRALLVVSPNNPTGSYLQPSELEQLTRICRRKGWPLIVDEVFADYALDASSPLTDIAARSEVLCFTLAGLSKTVGLPQLKLGWCIVGGPPDARDGALEALELVADSYLSVATPVQVAAGRLLVRGAEIRAAIQDRIRRNLDALRSIAEQFRVVDALPVEGGWAVVIRVPATRSEEQLALDLLRAERILIHPGYFFDFPREAYVVVSLLPPPEVFDDAILRLLRFVEC